MPLPWVCIDLAVDVYNDVSGRRRRRWRRWGQFHYTAYIALTAPVKLCVHVVVVTAAYET